MGLINGEFSEDEGDIDSLAPSRSMFKNLMPISNLANPETVTPSRPHAILLSFLSA